jgi:hypothetical protein
LNAGADAWGALIKHVGEAKRRNFTIDDCRVALGFAPLKNRQSKKQADGTYPVPTNETEWWRDTGNPKIFAFRDCISAYASNQALKTPKLNLQSVVARSIKGECDKSFFSMSRALVARFGTKKSRKIAKDLTESTFVPAVRNAVLAVREEQKDAVAHNNPDKTDWKAAFGDGLAAYNNGLTERAYKIWSRLADAGDADAQCHLGLMFQQGVYVTRNDRAAGNWFRMALDRGLKQGTVCELAAKKATSISKPTSLQDLDEKTTSRSKLSESRRIALVIGNNNYKDIPALDNPANDARDMAAALESLGFAVITALDANRFEMENKLADFAKSARTADVAVAFYAGHGMQHEGINYLIPVDGQLSDETDLRHFIKLRSVIEDMQNTKGARILIVDACRDNEALTRFAGSLPKTRSLAYGKGLANEGAEGVLIAYATQPGKVAVDEVGGKNSPFTAAILKHIKTADTDIRVMFTRVRKDVLEATEYKQRPEVSDSLSGEFAFN